MNNSDMVRQLEDKIMNGIVIPLELSNNMGFSTTGLGGLFLNYRSNTSNRLATENSRVQLTIFFDTTDGAGRYIGDIAGMEVTRAWDTKAPRGVKSKVDYRKIIDKVNKWILDNKAFLYQAIENK